MSGTRHIDRSAHLEVVLQKKLVEQLIGEQRYKERRPKDFDRDLALDKELVLRFVQEIRAAEWAKLEASTGDNFPQVR